MMERGLFISIEGTDGSGKSTQIDFIKKYLQQRGINPILTREPGGTEIGEMIREIVLNKQNQEMDSMTEALLYAAARAQHVAQVIKPALLRGETIICDRFVDSSIVYQGYGRGLGQKVQVINDYAVAGCMPDVTFLMKIDPSIGKSRIREEAQDRIEMEGIDFHMQVFDAYIQLEKMFPQRIIGIDAGKNIEEISNEIKTHLERILKNR